ncbi:MAG: anti-sigma factor [Rhodoferax sp.]|uniref:anti-sigma factor domain-containing protein n=1 Tax=Rhodoferax sp. TaxID=50421 RepID=UPI00301B626B
MNETTSPLPPIASSAWWRAATIGCLLIMAFAAATGVSMFEQFTAQVNQLQNKLKDVAQIKFIAVLTDDKQAPALLVTLDPLDNAMQIQRLSSVAEGREDSMQLWALPASGKPIALGVLGSSSKTLRLPATEKTLVNVPQLAISVENKGGAEPGAGPRLPYLFQGAVVQKAL